MQHATTGSCQFHNFLYSHSQWRKNCSYDDISILGNAPNGFFNAWIPQISTHTCVFLLTHWGRVTHICVGNLTIIGPDNGLSPGRCQAIIWTNAGILLIEPWGTNFSEILIGIHTFSFKKINLKMSSAKWRPFCLGLNVLGVWWRRDMATLTVVLRGPLWGWPTGPRWILLTKGQ